MNHNFLKEILINYKFLGPEIFILICILLNIFILFFNKNIKSNFSIIISGFFTFLGLIFGLKSIFLFQDSSLESLNLFNNFYIVTKEKVIFKTLILFALFFVHCFVFCLKEKNSFINKFGIGEISILLNLSSLGALFAISSSNFIFLYISLELQALSSYIIVSLKKNSKVSAEASLKYFVLGVLASSLMLFGISLVYFAFESFSFDQIYNSITSGKTHISNSQIAFSKIGMIGIVLIFCGLFFKLSAFPFHSWLADVYQGASNFAIGFLGVVPKIMAASVLFGLYHYVFVGEYAIYNAKIISVFAVISLIIGSISAIRQKNFKRLLAYSGVANSGFILISILGVVEFSIRALNLYFMGYIIAFFGLLSFAMFYWSEDSDQKDNYQIKDLHGIAKKYSLESIMLSFCLFSIAGIPPFIGFFGKFQILFSVFSVFNIVLIIAALLASVISLIYYLGILKILYFANYNDSDSHQVFLNFRKFLVLFGLLTIISSILLYFV